MKHFALAFLAAALVAVAPAHAQKTAGDVVDDNTINASIKVALVTNKKTEAHRINVETYKGIVQLSGFVDSQDEKDEATQVAASVSGVKQVRNSIAIGPSGTIGQKLDDSVTTGRVKAALIDSKDVKSHQINVETNAGVVQLSGFVTSATMRDSAARVAADVGGVKKVDNELMIKPH
jgi:hyperosmotically inducible protein